MLETETGCFTDVDAEVERQRKDVRDRDRMFY